MKRLSLLLSVLLLLPLFASCQSAPAYPPVETIGLPLQEATGEGKEGDWSYYLFPAYSAVSGYHGKQTSISIPETLGGKTVKLIAESAFAGNETLSSVSMPDSIVVIDRFAFENCTALTRVALSANLETVGAYAFRRSGLTEIELPSRLYSIGREAFMGTPLTSIVLPETVTRLDEYAFHACRALTEITLSPRVTFLANRTFESCSALTSFVIPETVTAIGDYTFANCSALTRLVIPPSVSTIGIGALVGNAALTVLVSSEEDAAAVWCKRNACTYRVATEEEWAAFYPEEDA